MTNHIDKGIGFTHHDDSGCCPCPCKNLTPKQKELLDAAVKKTVEQYGETLNLLSKGAV